jgi:epoxyqueuosine reductase
MSPEELKRTLSERALTLGFAECRVAVAKPAAHREAFARWVKDGAYGDMAWMARDPDRRSDPRQVLEGAQSVIVLAMNYYQGGERPHPGYRIARYAWNRDYHDMMLKRVKQLSETLTEHGGAQRCYVDTGPVLERDFASESGLGWNGKSTMQIHRQLGTWFFLAEILTTLELPPDEPEHDYCGRCTRCVDACPTQAITAPHRLDARRCISYFTIEHKGAIPEEFRRSIGDRIYGCDDCLDACPWNRFAQRSSEVTFQARETVFEKDLRDFLKLTDAEFRVLFSKSPIKRIKRPAFLRNVCVALGNTGTPDDIPALKEAAVDPDPLIAEHAEWAIGEIRRRCSPGLVAAS